MQLDSYSPNTGILQLQNLNQEPELQNLKLADWFNNKFVPGVEKFLDKLEEGEAKKYDRQRDTRTKKIQDAVAVANYMGDTDRANAVINSGGAIVEAGINVAAGNYVGAVADGGKILMGGLKEATRTAPIWNKQIQNANNWNEKYDRYGNELYLI